MDAPFGVLLQCRAVQGGACVFVHAAVCVYDSCCVQDIGIALRRMSIHTPYSSYCSQQQEDQQQQYYQQQLRSALWWYGVL